MEYAKRFGVILILVSAVTLTALISWAFDDGFGSAKKIDGKYVAVYCADGLDAAVLGHRLNIGPSDKIQAGKSAKTEESPEKELSEMLDTLYLQVSDITDMHLYSLRVALKVCSDGNQLNSIYNNLFNESLGGRLSFYVFSSNTIYVSADGFTKEIIGHEMTHAIICHYFVVPPPVKIQEILAMYVEYNLRRQP